MDDISAEELIPLVEQRRVIWDKNSDIFKDKALKAAAWREICCVFNPDFEELEEKEKKDFAKSVTTKWTHIRDAFLRSQRTQKRHSLRSGVSKKPRPYLYKSLLNFMANVNNPQITLDSSNESQSSTSSSNSDNVPPAKRMLKVDENKTLEEKLTAFLDSKLKYQQESSYIYFMKSILPSLSTFDDDENLEFQIGVLDLIQKIKRKRHNHGESSDDVKVFDT